MSEQQAYIGITLGPVFDTVNLATSPASLWAASFLFSQLNRTLCKLLTQNGVPEEDIISPYYSNDPNDPLLSRNDGVGMFHDRIIFKAGGFDINCFPELRRKAVDEIAALFELDAAFLQQYVMARAVRFEAVNPFIESVNRLNCLELAKPFVQCCPAHPILTVFGGSEKHRNEQLKRIARKLTASPAEETEYRWQLLKRDGTICQLGEIAADGVTTSTLKKHTYFALVRADGDRMTQIMQSLSEEAAAEGQEDETLKRCRNFSKQCFAYCAEIADAVKRFGGVTIYAGGDDLLALLPCENREGETVLSFVKTANEIFEQCFRDYNKDTSLSFGILLCYHKFPLYEGMEESEHLLFDVAKNRRNCVALRLQKHSGQSAGLLIDNSALPELLELQKTALKPRNTAQNGGQAEKAEKDEKDEKGEKDEKDEKVILSALYKLETFHALLQQAETENEIKELFANLFDAEAHTNSDFLHKRLPEFYYALRSKGLAITPLTDEHKTEEEEADAKLGTADGAEPQAAKRADAAHAPEDTAEEALQSLCYVLRILKFFKEKEGKRG